MKKYKFIINYLNRHENYNLTLILNFYKNSSIGEHNTHILILYTHVNFLYLTNILLDSSTVRIKD